MPKLKTHHWAGMTASMKNFFGVVPGAVYGWPKNILHVHGIHNSIVDLNATIRPAPLDRRRRDRDGRRRADNGNATAVGHDRHRTGCLCRGCDLCARDWTRSRSDSVSRGSGKVPRTHERIPNRSHEGSPWPVSPRGSRLSIPSSPAAWTGADRFGTSRSKSGAAQIIVWFPPELPLPPGSGLTEVQRICVASDRFRRHLLCDCYCENTGVACTPSMGCSSPGSGIHGTRPLPSSRKSRPSWAPPQRCLPRLTCTFTSPGVWRSGTRPRQVNTRCLASPDCWPPRSRA